MSVSECILPSYFTTKDVYIQKHNKNLIIR